MTIGVGLASIVSAGALSTQFEVRPGVDGAHLSSELSVVARGTVGNACTSGSSSYAVPAPYFAVQGESFIVAPIGSSAQRELIITWAVSNPLKNSKHSSNGVPSHFKKLPGKSWFYGVAKKRISGPGSQGYLTCYVVIFAKSFSV
jgi:hypothetical protein